MRRLLAIFCLLFSCQLLTGCQDEIEKMKLSPEDRDRILPLQNPFGKNLVRLNVPGTDRVELIGLGNCRLYRAVREEGVVTGWLKIKEVDNMNILGSSCDRYHFEYDGKHLYFSYCSTAIGAGGGCGGGMGSFRTENGRDWQKYSGNDNWAPVVKK